ncbi:MAG: PAS domain S-box protein [Desulfatitalea sp.]|nr:PAS domain S-box protein [Desulfatitalea sp.]NNK01160.1 PAS domain S-box protein [Desulfatitalea sp.]
MNEKLYKELDWRLRVFDSLSFPTLILKPDRKILSANQIFLQRQGVEMEHIVGKRCYELFYGVHTCPNKVCPFPKVLAEKKGTTVMRRHTTRTGKRIFEDRVFSPILDDEGNVAYILESVRDVTRQKNLELALKETEAFLEKVILGSPIAIVAADRYGHILLMNPAAEDLFGYTNSHAMSHVTAEQLYPAGVAVDIMRRLKAGKGKLPSIKTEIINARSEIIPVELTASIIYEDDEEVATVGIYTDLREKLAVESKLRKTRAQLAQSEKMASMGQLAAGVAHEINNPLTGILFYATLKLEGMTTDDTERADVEAVIDDVKRCKEIVQNLLAYSRQSSPMKDIIQLNDIVEQSMVLIRDPKMFRNVIIKRAYSDEMMLLHVDKNQISQVIINLVINAVSAMNGAGTLTLKTYRDKRFGKAYLEVADTGCGIPVENIDKIFDPFYTTKAPGEGTGLGLSTAYGLVKENRGNIRVKHTDDAGTAFLLEFELYHSPVAPETT